MKTIEHLNKEYLNKLTTEELIELIKQLKQLKQLNQLELKNILNEE